ncbi:hypothetical protein LTR94_028685, partial [Friedmanniomyces endolithicus]
NIVPSFYAGQNSISDASTFVRSPSLRGLAGDQVLVMLNGKRYNRAALVQVYGGSDTGLGRGAQGPDISAIPSLAIGSLQVLREGATAQYGSDAIAGVLNDAGNVLGMMPHPERRIEPAHGGTDGRRLFEGLLETIGA